MELSNLRPAEGSKHSDNFRRGRGHGSGNGKTAGKGHKGQLARSGHKKPGFEGGQMPLYLSLIHIQMCIRDRDSRWYAESDFADYLVEDYNIRTFLKKKLYSAGVSKIEIERASDRVKIIIYTAKPCLLYTSRCV